MFLLGLIKLLTNLASIPQSGGNTQLWQDIRLEQEPDNENAYDDPYIGHSVSPQPPAEMTYAHENPLDDVAHEEGTEAFISFEVTFEEKVDSRRSGFDAPHLVHLTGSLSVEKTICSNSCPHLEHRNSYSGIGSSLC